MKKVDILKLLNDTVDKKAAAVSQQTPKKPKKSYVADEEDFEKYTPVGADGLLAASEKLLAVSKGVADPDDRDALFNDRVMTPDRLMAERIKLDTNQTLRKLMIRAARSRTLQYFKPGHFDEYTQGYLVGNPLVTATEQVNPMHMMEQQRRVTKMGPGGIGDPNAITVESQAVHGSQFGFISPIEGPECFDEQSEVYTLRGWVRWEDVKDDDIFACLIDGRLEYHKASRIVREDYKGDMMYAETETLRLKVTPNHRIIFTPWIGKKEYLVKRASEVFQEHAVASLPIRHEPELGDEKFTHFTLPQAERADNDRCSKVYDPFPIEDWCRLMGWWLSEGSTNTYGIRISQCSIASPENHEEIELLWARLGFKHNPEADYAAQEFNEGSIHLKSYFSQWSSGCYDKWIPEELFKAPVKAREALLDALLKGDGRYNAKRWCYCTVSHRLARDVERLCIGLGYTAFIRIEEDRRDHVTTTNYVVSIHRQNHRTIKKVGHSHSNGKVYGGLWKWVDYEGKVYCATVPGGMLHVRGKSSTSGHWSGNSERAGIDVRLAGTTRFGSDGKYYSRRRNKKTGKVEWVSPDDMYGKTLKLPD